MALRRVARGDVSALGEVYDRYAGALLRFTSRVVGRQDAEDLVQATFMKVIRVAATYDGRSDCARPWLFGIAARLIQERSRALSRFTRALFQLTQLALVARGEVVVDQGSRSELERGLMTLSEAKRVVVVLAEIEGYTCDEIAAMLAIPVGTVWTRLHHARKELRAFYAAEIP